MAGGGVTVSGGEPLLQPAFTRACFGGCKEGGCTPRSTPPGSSASAPTTTLLGVTDLVLLDIKSFDPGTYRRLTGGGRRRRRCDFARRLADRGTAMWIRFVLVPGVTDDPDNVAGWPASSPGSGSVERVEVLPFHRLGAHKYEALRMRFPLEDTPTPDAELIERTRSQFAERQLPVLSA